MRHPVTKYICTAAMALMLSACAQSGEDTSVSVPGTLAESESNGTVIISMTDAPGDFANYDVTVTSVSLLRQDGLLVETLPIITRVDFAQYVELTEFLTAATVPNGVYTAGSLTLDYSDSTILVEAENGAVIQATSLVNEDGESLQSVTLPVNLENSGSLLIAPGIPAHLTLDFDLQASNTVEFSATGDATVVVEPLLLAEIERESHKTHRARGALHRVNLPRQSFSIHLQPFRHRIRDEQRFGTLNVQASDQTAFEVDGVSYTGIEGLRSMQQLPRLSAVVAKGKFRKDPFRFIADEVYAGSSVPNGDLDVARGNVIARIGNEITLQGVTLERNDGSVTFNETVSLLVSGSTVVTQQAGSASGGSPDISVGQRLNAVGVLQRSATGNAVFDASEGSVRLLLTRLGGVVVDESSSNLIVNLSSIDRRNVADFDFDGTGVSAEFDADPAAYEIDTAMLSTESLSAGGAVRIAGHIRGFGLAPADFSAHTIADVGNLPAVMRVTWIADNALAIDTSRGDALQLDLQGTGRFHHVSQSGVKIDLQQNDLPPVVQLSERTRVYTIRVAGEYERFSDMHTFIARLNTLLAEGLVVVGLMAPGNYNAAGNTVHASRLSVHLSRPNLIASTVQ